MLSAPQKCNQWGRAGCLYTKCWATAAQPLPLLTPEYWPPPQYPVLPTLEITDLNVCVVQFRGPLRLKLCCQRLIKGFSHCYKLLLLLKELLLCYYCINVAFIWNIGQNPLEFLANKNLLTNDLGRQTSEISRHDSEVRREMEEHSARGDHGQKQKQPGNIKSDDDSKGSEASDSHGENGSIQTLRRMSGVAGLGNAEEGLPVWSRRRQEQLRWTHQEAPDGARLCQGLSRRWLLIVRSNWYHRFPWQCGFDFSSEGWLNARVNVVCVSNDYDNDDSDDGGDDDNDDDDNDRQLQY